MKKDAIDKVMDNFDSHKQIKTYCHQKIDEIESRGKKAIETATSLFVDPNNFHMDLEAFADDADVTGTKAKIDELFNEKNHLALINFAIGASPNVTKSEILSLDYKADFAYSMSTSNFYIRMELVVYVAKKLASLGDTSAALVVLLEFERALSQFQTYIDASFALKSKNRSRASSGGRAKTNGNKELQKAKREIKEKWLKERESIIARHGGKAKFYDDMQKQYQIKRVDENGNEIDVNLIRDLKTIQSWVTDWEKELL